VSRALWLAYAVLGLALHYRGGAARIAAAIEACERSRPCRLNEGRNVMEEALLPGLAVVAFAIVALIVLAPVFRQ
jgi:hypothetical protein